MIPKIVHTIWLGDKMPAWISDCIDTHIMPGYEHNFITDENCFRGTRYINECLDAGKWAKAADYLRLWYLFKYGGLYLDADVEILKPFDDLLDQDMFVGKEENEFVSNAIIGSIAGHPILEDCLGKMERNFIGGGDLIFQPGMYLWTEVVRYSNRVNIFPPEFFLPYNHHNGKINVTDNTYCIHHFSKSWLKEKV